MTLLGWLRTSMLLKNILFLLLLGNVQAAITDSPAPFDAPEAYTAVSMLYTVVTSIQKASASLAPCYYPNGEIETRDMPCSDNGGACCREGWDCLSSGLCCAPGMSEDFQRQTCTDKRWGSSCPDMCTRRELPLLPPPLLTVLTHRRRQ